MSKTKSSAIPHYEMLYMVSNKFSEDEFKLIVERVNKILSDNGCTITLNETWGKKKLAYPIQSFRHGYYSLVEFDAAGETIAKIDKILRMINEILRHQIVTKKIKTSEQIERDKKIAEKIAAKALNEEKAAKEISKDKEKEKVDLKDLDDKLDKILETGDLL